MKYTGKKILLVLFGTMLLYGGTSYSPGFTKMPGYLTAEAGVKPVVPAGIIESKKPVEVVSFYNGEPDAGHRAGAACANIGNGAEGERITLNSVAKAGYRLKEYQIEGYPGLRVTDGTFAMPSGNYQTLKVMAVFEENELRQPMTFYVDSAQGNDASSGNSEKTAWKTLNRVKQHELFVPGDRILLKRGSVFQGQQLAFSGMGNQKAPIVIGAYGEGELPRLDGEGKVENVVSLYNQEYITISDLEITNLASEYRSDFGLNTSDNKQKPLRAINVSIKDFGTASGISIRNCYIHDINGNIGLKWNGGIFFDVKADIVDGKLSGVPSKYDHVIISGCTFERVDRSGIKLVNSSWCNQWEQNAPGVPVNWYPSTNVVVKENYMEKIGGDGITVRDTDGALIERNLVRDCRYQETGYNVGIWPFEASNTVIQYNEAYDTHSVQDGQGFDCDHASSNSIMQYNYSHNNEGGFMLIMGGYPHTGATIRYNISQNDRDKTFEFAQGCPKGVMIYNNTIYSDCTIPKGIFYLSNAKKGVGVNEAYVFNNLFYYPEGQILYGESEDKAKLQENIKLYNNAYLGGVSSLRADPNAVEAGEAGLVSPGLAPRINDTHKPVVGDSGRFEGYKLAEGSKLIDAGVTLEEAVSYFGGKEPFDGRTLSPRELYELARKGTSIKHVVGRNFPAIEGVNYNQDFLGNKNRYGEKPDIGAVEFMPEK